MKNQKSPGSDGITTEFYKMFWNDIKEYYIKSDISDENNLREMIFFQILKKPSTVLITNICLNV